MEKQLSRGTNLGNFGRYAVALRRTIVFILKKCDKPAAASGPDVVAAGAKQYPRPALKFCTGTVGPAQPAVALMSHSEALPRLAVGGRRSDMIKTFGAESDRQVRAGLEV
jgi:hypothetical protein